MTNPLIQTPPYSNPVLAEKLLKTIKKHKTLVIGVDYDNTIQDYNSKYFYEDIIDLVKLAKSKGHTICIWTANTQPTIVKMMLAYQGIPYDYFNNSPLMNNSRKPHFNILLDDVAGLNEAYHTLNHVLKKKQHENF